MSEFFEPPSARRSEPKPDPEWAGPPDHVLPATVPIERIVAENDKVAIYLACLSAYPAGFDFDVFAIARDEWIELDPFSFDHQYEAERTGEIPPGQLRLGFLFGDGSKAFNTGDRFDWEGEFESAPDKPVMSGQGRGRSENGRWHSSLWVWPLPPDGQMEFICEWPAADIPLTRCELDAQQIIAAASRAQHFFAADR